MNKNKFVVTLHLYHIHDITLDDIEKRLSNEELTSFLHFLFHKHEYKLCSKLIKNGGNYNKQMTLPIAISMSDIEAIKYLIEKNVDIQVFSVLEQIFTKNNLDITQLFLDSGIDVNMKSGRENSLFEVWTCVGKNKQIKLFIKNGYDLTSDMYILFDYAGYFLKSIVEMLEEDIKKPNIEKANIEGKSENLKNFRKVYYHEIVEILNIFEEQYKAKTLLLDIELEEHVTKLLQKARDTYQKLTIVLHNDKDVRAPYEKYAKEFE